jgi:hypothetical protein
MGVLEVSQTITIDRPADVVRRQFADVAHHQATGVHRGIRFEVIDDDGQRCRYRQVSRVGLLHLTQELELPHTDEGPLVNTVTRGQFQGGTITFVVEAGGKGHSTVEARVASPMRGLEALMLPVLRSKVRRTLARALAEDKADLESGNYAG